MTTREKTVCFSFPMYTGTMTDATVTNLTQITLYIPESSPTFTSVFVEVGFQDVITATGGTITEHRCGLQLGSAGYSTITETDDITHSGENMGGVLGPFDFTSYFNTNWSGTSKTCDLQVYFDQSTGTTQGMANVTALVWITYSYNDSAATQIKTAMIPLESLTGGLPTTASNFGTSQIPQLTSTGGFLPEAGVTIRDYFFVIEGNENTATTTGFTLSASIDGGTATAFRTQEAALASDRFLRWVYQPTVPSTTATHNFNLWSSVASKCNHITVTLYVTYEFTLAGTTRVLNSILLPIEINSPLGRNTSAEASRFQRTVWVQEPGTITLKQSGFRINYNVPASLTAHLWKAGGQAYRSYSPLAGVVAGMFSVQQRIDSGSAQGAGITLSRGMNSFTLDGYTTNATTEMTNISGYILLNYHSDLAPAGIGAHNHTVRKVVLGWDALLSDLTRINNWSFSIPENNYYITAVSFLFYQWVTSASMAVSFDVECLSTEGKGGGYYDIYTAAYVADSELGCSLIWMRGRDAFRRFPDDVGADRVDIETARDYRLYTTSNTSNGLLSAITYHGLTWSISGNLVGADPAKTTELKLIRRSTNEILQQKTLSAGTTNFAFVVYDNTEDYCVDAYQDSTHLGRSNWGTGV